ncbi:MAG: hypothetical protein DRI90_10220 [Deltaproteobacteria bacterium]|nr:MAG: hypothetical protein DRI90_10220 [Deltaproteobacteria bacterium]
MKRVKCAYCGRTNKVAETRTLLPHTPANWQPPAVWKQQHWKAPEDCAAEALTALAIGGPKFLRKLAHEHRALLVAIPLVVLAPNRGYRASGFVQEVIGSFRPRPNRAQ